MSYEIIYDRVFIKTDRYLVPLVLMGSSNCYEFINGREVRERSWQELSFTRNFSFTEKELLTIISNLSIGSDCIRYNGKYISDMKAWMLRGIKEAKSLEDILDASGLPELMCRLVVPTEPLYCGTRMVASDKELNSAIDELLTLREEHKGSYINFCFPTREKLKRPKRNVQGEVVAKKGNRYLSGIDSETSIRTTVVPTEAMTFDSVEEAKEIIPSIWLCDLKFISSDCKKKVWGISVHSEGCQPRYVKKITRTKVHFSPKEDVSLRFKSKKEAQRYIENRRYIFSRLFIVEPVLLTE